MQIFNKSGIFCLKIRKLMTYVQNMTLKNQVVVVGIVNVTKSFTNDMERISSLKKNRDVTIKQPKQNRYGFRSCFEIYQKFSYGLFLSGFSTLI